MLPPCVASPELRRGRLASLETLSSNRSNPEKSKKAEAGSVKRCLRQINPAAAADPLNPRRAALTTMQSGQISRGGAHGQGGRDRLGHYERCGSVDDGGWQVRGL